MIISRSFLTVRNVSDKSCRENQNIHFVLTNYYYYYFFSFENRAFYEIMWKNAVQADRPQMTIWRMRIACWVPKATNTLSRICNTYCFSLQQWLYERASLLRYTYIAFRVFISETECVNCAVRNEPMYTIEGHVSL